MVFGYIGSRDPVRQFRRDMDRLLSGFAHEFADGGWPWGGRGQPPVNIWEAADAVMLEMEVPGVKSDAIDLAVVGTELTVKVDRPPREPKDVTYHRRERPGGSYTRVLRLPTEVAADKIQAELRHGVLTVTLPKAEAAKPRKIQIMAK